MKKSHRLNYLSINFTLQALLDIEAKVWIDIDGKSSQRVLIINDGSMCLVSQEFKNYDQTL